ncbi:MAG: phospholipase D-like domain-containing protein, partial [Thermodesulfobacteriota bacterium]|nr:phospholipase D-like domain-containing protein [Thermodesulfobacteriota bacterium]
MISNIHKRTSLISVIIFIFLFLSVRVLFAEAVQIITDRQYYPQALLMIQNAKKTINLIMFEAAYYKKYPDSPSNELIRELIRARNRNVKVEVILEAMDKKQDRATQRNYQTGKILSGKGVEVFYDSKDKTTHAKVLIVDGESILMGSANWTYHALVRNHEVNVLIKSPEQAKKLITYFNDIKLTTTK